MSARGVPERIPADQDWAWLGQAVLHDIPDAVIYSDREGVIRFWNPGATRIFGFAAEEAIGQSLDIIIPERLRQRHWDGYHHMMATGRSQHPPEALLSVPAQTKSGDALSIQFTVAPVTGEDGATVGIVAVLRDVTATFREMKQLRRAQAISAPQADSALPGAGRPRGLRII